MLYRRAVTAQKQQTRDTQPWKATAEAKKPMATKRKHMMFANVMQTLVAKKKRNFVKYQLAT